MKRGLTLIDLLIWISIPLVLALWIVLGAALVNWVGGEM